MTPSLRPSLSIARVERALMDHRVLGRRDVARLALVRRLVDPHVRDAVVRRVVHDALRRGGVEILRPALDFHQRVAAAAAPALVHHAELRTAAVVRRDDRLRLLHHQVIRHVVHVGQLPRAAAVMSAVRVGRGRAGPEDLAHAGVADRSAGEAARGRLEVAGPFLGRHPDFDLHVGVAGAFDRTGDAAERRQILERGRRAFAAAPGRRRREGAGRDQLRRGNRRVRQRQRREALARCRRGRRRAVRVPRSRQPPRRRRTRGF